MNPDHWLTRSSANHGVRRALVGSALLALILGLGSCHGSSSPGSKLGRVVVGLGMTVDEVKALSTEPITGGERQGAREAFVANTYHSTVIRGLGPDVVLQRGGSTSFETYAGKIVHVSSAGAVLPADRKNSAAFVANVGACLERDGWKLDPMPGQAGKYRRGTLMMRMELIDNTGLRSAEAVGLSGEVMFVKIYIDDEGKR